MGSSYLRVSVEGRTVTFRDVPTSSWFAPAVASLAERGIVSGYKGDSGFPLGLYRPNQAVTYAEAAKMLLEAAGKARNVASLSQVDANWASPYLRRARELQFVAYRSASGDLPVTRGAFLQTLVEAFDLPAAPGMAAYRDLPARYPYAQAIITATNLGLIRGDTNRRGQPRGTVRPNDPINRAEVAKILSLILDKHTEGSTVSASPAN